MVLPPGTNATPPRAAGPPRSSEAMPPEASRQWRGLPHGRVPASRLARDPRLARTGSHCPGVPEGSHRRPSPTQRLARAPAAGTSRRGSGLSSRASAFSGVVVEPRRGRHRRADQRPLRMGSAGRGGACPRTGRGWWLAAARGVRRSVTGARAPSGRCWKLRAGSSLPSTRPGTTGITDPRDWDDGDTGTGRPAPEPGGP
jgi:hypothetical protein